jgi:hypothetical protein
MPRDDLAPHLDARNVFGVNAGSKPQPKTVEAKAPEPFTNITLNMGTSTNV